MAGPVPAIHVVFDQRKKKDVMLAPSAGMTGQIYFCYGRLPAVIARSTCDEAIQSWLGATGWLASL
jgi:hypothetical protein